MPHLFRVDHNVHDTDFLLQPGCQKGGIDRNSNLS